MMDEDDGLPTNKRPREVRPEVEDLLFKARMIMHNDPFKDRTPKEEELNFRALFGCGVNVAIILWSVLVEHSLVPINGTMTHYLWTLMFLKNNPRWKTMRTLTGGADPKTLRKWIFGAGGAGGFLAAIAQVEPIVIQWRKRLLGDIGNDCLVSIDGVDCNVPFSGRKFHSHKFKQGSGLWYEVGVSIINGELVWLNGPYECGKWPDVEVFRNALKSMLGEGERVEADDGYRGEAPEFVKCPVSIMQLEETDRMQSIVRRRHETINKRFKQFSILKNVYKNEIRYHGDVFRACAIITQIAISNGEPLFDVEYEDPHLDDYYFDETDGEDDPEDL